MCIHCLGHFFPLPPAHPSRPTPPCFQAEPVLPLSLIMLKRRHKHDKRRHKHDKKDKVFLVVKDSYTEIPSIAFVYKFVTTQVASSLTDLLHWFLIPFSCWPVVLRSFWNPDPTYEIRNFEERSFGTVTMNRCRLFENYSFLSLCPHLFSLRKDLEMTTGQCSAWLNLLIWRKQNSLHSLNIYFATAESGRYLQIIFICNY
jgi:hypothetical protein